MKSSPLHMMLGALGVLPPLPERKVPPPVEPIREEIKPGEPRGAFPRELEIIPDPIAHRKPVEEWPLVHTTGSSPLEDPGFARYMASLSKHVRREERTNHRSKSEKKARRLKRKNTRRNRK